ncbi:MAG: hypothetical protein LBK12_04285, partial [Odoribacteraceae bacterium]|nr:hypothetical protein [Odoribacteraceae bacterium]
MKKIILFLLIASTFAACGDWLDVSPLGEVKEEDMYKTEDGFKGVLTGAYIAMTSKDLYGHHMTMQMPELLARHWEVINANSAEAYLRDYDFEKDAAKAVVASSWMAYYN